MEATITHAAAYLLNFWWFSPPALTPSIGTMMQTKAQISLIALPERKYNRKEKERAQTVYTFKLSLSQTQKNTLNEIIPNHTSFTTIYRDLHYLLNSENNNNNNKGIPY